LAMTMVADGDHAGALMALDEAPRLDEHSAEGYQLRATVREAEELYEGALEDWRRYGAYATDEEERRHLGRTLLRVEGLSLLQGKVGSGQFADARRAFTDALEPNPVRSNLNRAMGEGLYAVEDWRGALDAFTAAMQEQGATADLLERRGSARFSLRDFTGARGDYDRAIELDPKRAELYVRRGKAHYFTGAGPDAFSDFSRAIELDPANAEALTMRGHIQMAAKTYEKARADYAAATEADPTNGWAWLALANARAALEDSSGALAAYAEAIKVMPGLGYMRRGNLYTNLKEWKKASEDFTRSMAADAERPDPHFYRAQCHVELKNTSMAISDLERFLQMAPNHPLGRIAKAKLSLLRGR
jgi:tetratricopeptide (TPR) repeat protein